jgi:hypothetical protein
MGMERARTRANEMTPVYAVLGCLALLTTIQLLLLSVAVEAFLAREAGVLWPAAGVSAACCGAACWLATLVASRPL